jgi:flagellar assembly protein FliH
LKEIREEAYREGLEKGRMEGAGEALQEAMATHEQQIQTVEGMVVDLRTQCESRLENHRHDIYEMSKRLLKWLVLKEVQDDGYVPKLLEKLILEMNQRQNLIIRVNHTDFANMPAVVEALEKRIGNLPNVRIEPDMEMKGRGIILETENGILDASPDALFQTIDKIYESVVNHGR